MYTTATGYKVMLSPYLAAPVATVINATVPQAPPLSTIDKITLNVSENVANSLVDKLSDAMYQVAMDLMSSIGKFLFIDLLGTVSKFSIILGFLLLMIRMGRFSRKMITGGITGLVISHIAYLGWA